MHLERIRCRDIRPEPGSARPASRDFDALADSIRQHGVLRPVLLRATADGYVIVHGEGRWRAAQMAGLETIPATIVQDVSREPA
jgi:ParB family transcriptional regulator, chromosome partitioning protein